MIDNFHPGKGGKPGDGVASPRRLPTFWRWTTRTLWIAIFVVMVLLNTMAIVAYVQRNASGIHGGAAGVRAVNIDGLWVVHVDVLGPAAQMGIQSGDALLAVNGVSVEPDASFAEVNRLFFGEIGAPLTLKVGREMVLADEEQTPAEPNSQGRDQVAPRTEYVIEEHTFALVVEDSLQIWRRFRVPLGIESSYLPTLEAVMLGIYLLISALIFSRRWDDWLALYLTATLVLITPQMSYSWYYLSLTAPHWQETFPLLISIAVALTLPNFYLLPNGRFVPRGSLYLVILWALFCIVTEFFPNAPFSIYQLPGTIQLLVWLGWFATGMWAQFYRYRNDATPTEQQQIKWVGFGLTVAVIVNLGWTLAFELFPILSLPGQPHQLMWYIGRTIYVLGMMVLPISFGIAVFRYRLWDIDNLINRTLVYGTLTAVIVGVYVTVVAIFDALFSSEGQMVSQIIAITLDLIIFEPLRDRLQVGVDRLMFGESEELPVVVTRLGQRLGDAMGPEDVLPTIVETLAESLNSPYVAITLLEGETFRIAASRGDPVQGHYVWPLIYHRQMVGQLILAARGVGEPLKPKEWQVIEQISYHVSAAAHDILLENELTVRRGEAGNSPKASDSAG